MKMTILCSIIGVAGSVLASFFGGWDAALTTLLIFMAIDFVSGLIVGGVFHTSTKTETGALESKAGFKGLCRKALIILFVLVGYRLDLLLGTDTTYVKDSVCIAFIINELISIVENAGLMGIPVPQVIVKAIDVLKSKKDATNNDESEMGAGKMTFDEFVKAYLGKATDQDGVSGVQCVDLAKLYIKYVIGVTPQSIGHAHAYADNFSKTYLKKYFKPINYKLGVKPQKGDLVVWGLKYNGTSEYGHIAIATGEYSEGIIYTYDQNYGGKAMHKVKHTTKGISKLLRPIDQSNIKTAPTIKAGQVLTLTTAVKVRKGAGKGYAQLKRNQLTADGKKNAKLGIYAVLKKGTKVTVQQVFVVNDNIWVRIPSGYIVVYYNGDTYAK